MRWAEPRDQAFEQSHNHQDTMDPELEAAAPEAEDENLTLEQPAEGEAPEAELDDDGNPIEQPSEEDELEEVEFDGKKGKVSKALKDGYLRHADYTQKTQALSVEKAEVEEGRKAVLQTATTHRAMLADAAKVVSLSEQLAEFEKVTPEQWMAAHARDPDQTAQARMRMQLLREERDRAVSSLQTKEQQRLQDEQQETAKRVEQRDAVLARDIKGWSKDSLGKLADDAKDFGISRDEVLGTTDPRFLKVLNEAISGRQAKAKLQGVQRHQAAQATQPAPSAGGTPAPARRDPSKMGFKDFEKYAQGVLAKG